MPYKENYTREDTENNKTKTIIYTYPLKGTFKPWANKYLGLRKYYNSLKIPDD